MLDELKRAVDTVARSVDPAEFAFLALTSKIELAFRDRLAHALAIVAEPRGERVAREWKRCDLAWLRGSEPALLVELKACYTFDLVAQPDVYFGYVKADLFKARSLARPGAYCFAILLATHSTGPVPACFYDTIKYAAGVNSAIAKFDGADGVRKRAIAEAETRLGDFSSGGSFELKLGTYLGIGAHVLGWIVSEPIVAAA